MHARDYRDMIGGTALVFIGAFAAIYALTSLSVGTPSHMGPGMFPVALGCALVVFGVVILVPAMFRTGELVSIDLRSTVTILASLLAFALIQGPFGMIPAIAVLTLIASRADSKLSLIGVGVVAAVLSLGATLIFVVGLEVPIAIVSWPW